MILNGRVQIAVVLAALVPLGRHTARLFTGRQNYLHPALGPIEAGL